MKWMNLAEPDAPGVWYDVDDMWPTKRGSYETADYSSATSYSALSANAVIYAFAGQALTGKREYLIADSGAGAGAGKIWELTGGALVDRTGGVTAGAIGTPMMAMYGSIVILVNGVSQPTVSSSGGNFSALAGAPRAEIVVVQSNAVVCFNTNANVDGWHASDVGDYTNWTTGESASGRIITTPGPILAAVPFGRDILVFKSSAIYRMTYVGGVVKWQISIAWNGLGVAYSDATSYTTMKGKYQVVACRAGVVFNAHTDSQANSVYLFDGSSPPVCLNPLTSLNESSAVFLYHPIEDVLVLAPAYGSDASGTVRYNNTVSAQNSRYYYYSFLSDAWGNGSGSEPEDWELAGNPVLTVNGVLQGDYYARAETSIKPVYWRYRNVTTAAFYRCAPASVADMSCYLETAKIGLTEAKTLFDTLIPQLRRRTDLGTDSATLLISFFRDREDTTAARTVTATEIANPKRFTFTGTDNFARFKVTWTSLDIECDGFKIPNKYAGKH